MRNITGKWITLSRVTVNKWTSAHQDVKELSKTIQEKVSLLSSEFLDLDEVGSVINCKPPKCIPFSHNTLIFVIFKNKELKYKNNFVFLKNILREKNAKHTDENAKKSDKNANAL